MVLACALGLGGPAAAEDYPESVGGPPACDEDPKPGMEASCCESRAEGYTVCRDCSQTLIDSFYFSNQGVNRVVTEPYDPLKMSPQRWFQFYFHSHAREGLYFSISDLPTGTVSSFLESYFMIFPRRVLPSIRQEAGRTVVTLPNAEQVQFDAASNEIVGGAFAETGKLEAGIYPRLEYRGRGVLLRVDRRGADPRLGTTATITRGSSSCRIPAAELWSQESPVRFRFPTDAAFDAFLQSRCSFGLPAAPKVSRIKTMLREFKTWASLDR